MLKQPRKRTLILGISLVLLVGVSFIVYQFLFPLFIIWQDSRRVPCDRLPNLSQAQQIFNEHNDTVEQLEKISPNNVFISLVERCPGKGEVEIMYDTINTRNQIKKLIGDSFFGIPYVMFNI